MSVVTLNSLSSDVADVEIQEDVIAALRDQGYKQAEAEAVVRASFRPGDTFEEALRSALAVEQARQADASKHRGNSGPQGLIRTVERSSKAALQPKTRPGQPSMSEPRGRAHAAGARPQFDSAPTTLASTQPNPQLQPSTTRKETHVATKCACGCGEDLKPGSPWKYKRGHKPKAATAGTGSPAAPVRRRAKAAKNKAPRRQMKRRATNGKIDSAAPQPGTAIDDRPPVNLGMLEIWLNDRWDRMPLAEKVELICGQKAR